MMCVYGSHPWKMCWFGESWLVGRTASAMEGQGRTQLEAGCMDRIQGVEERPEYLGSALKLEDISLCTFS